VTEEQSAEGARPSRWRVHGRPSPALWFAIVVIVPITSLLFRLRYRHGERIPRRGPVLLVANHVSLLDPLACARMTWDHGRVPHFLAKQSLFTGWLGAILRSAGQIPVARYSADAHTALGAARAALESGACVVIYPEGSVTRDPDWWPMQARTGVARLALTTDAVVVPVAQWGPQRVHDYHARKLRLRLRAPADYLVGEPVDLAAVRAEVRAGRALDPELLRGTTDAIMARVRDLLAELRDEPAPPAVTPRPARGDAAGDVPGDIAGDAA
jgi:1-acyl-sn-glycerol-3-phosphate acyltransferase